MKINGLRVLVIVLTIATAAWSQTPGKEWRTPWGDPDLQGSWSNATTTPLQRPGKYAGRETLTPEERRALDQQTKLGTDQRAAPGTEDDLAGAYNALWWDRGFSDGRTSLIYDPPDGRIPPLSAAAKKRKSEVDGANQVPEIVNGPEQLPLYTRCIVRSPLPRVPTGYDNNYEIVQSPGYVAIFQEQITETRIVPLDRRPHIDSSVRQWLGDSHGHWEGNTLVVETTNFNDQARFEGSSQNIVLIERWTRVADDRIDYRFTVTDPETWSKPWSAAIAWTKTGTLYEYACNEDNYGMYGILSGSRAKEKAAEK